MTRRQENKLSMARAVQSILQMNDGVITTITAFAAARNDLDNIISDIHALGQTQEKQTSGTTEDKNAREEKAINAALRLIGATKAYAAEHNDATLARLVDYSKSDLKVQRDTSLVNTLTQLKETIMPLQAKLASHGVTAADLTAFGKDVTAFSEMVAAPRINSALKGEATEQMRRRFEDMDKVFTRLDGLAEMKRDSDPEFYLAFERARAIVDNKGGSGKEEDEEIEKEG